MDLKWNMDFNLRGKAWSIGFDKNQLRLTAINNKINQMEYKGIEVLEDFENKTDEEIQDFIEEFQNLYGVKRGDAFMLIPRSAVQVQIAEFPLEAKTNLDEVMEYQLGNFFPGNLDEMHFFPQIIGETDQLKVMIVAVPKGYLGQSFAYIRRWSLKLAGIALDSFALVNGLAKLAPKRFTEDITMAFVFYDDGIEMLSINRGRLTASAYFKLPEAQDSEAMVPYLEQGFSQARLDPNEVDHYLQVYDNQPDLKWYLEESVGFPFETWQDGVGNEVPPKALVGFGGAVSAVLDKLPLESNMLPENLRKRHKQLPLILATVLLSILALLFVVSEYREYSELKRESASLEQRHMQVMGMLAEVAAARSTFEDKQTELLLYRPFQADALLRKIMYSLSQGLPEDTYLTSFQVKSRDRLTLQGESENPFNIERILKEMDFLTGVKPTNSITAGRNTGKRKFVYKATIVLEALR